MSFEPRILLCRCEQAHALSLEAVTDLERRLALRAQSVDRVGDLCAEAARRPGALKARLSSGSWAIVACHARAVRALLETAAMGESVTCFDLRSQSAADVEGELERFFSPTPAVSCEEKQVRAQSTLLAGGPPQPPESLSGLGAWFPVLDRARCTNCLQCLSFCLFGVYGVDAARQVVVQAPDNCKTNCPACSRVCPEQAIVFPKHSSAPINGGEAAGAPAGSEKVDISALLGGDIYATLRERGKTGKRFSKDRDPQTALRERQAWLAREVQAGVVPPEVLAHLPPAEELARLAAEARKRVAEARRKD